MEIIPLETSRVIKAGEDIIDTIAKLIRININDPSTKDLIVISIKAISISKKYIIEISSIHPSKKALKLSEEYKVSPEIVELILRKKIIILGGAEGVLATLNNGILIGNGGLDRKNVEGNYIVYWPDNPDEEAYKIRRGLYDRLGIWLGVILVDSHVNPLRKGTTGIVIGLAGFNPLKDYIGKRDLYGRKIRFTVQNIADELASAAHIYMGEGTEKTPFVYIKNSPITFCEYCTSDMMKLNPSECIYMRDNFSRMELSIYR